MTKFDNIIIDKIVCNAFIDWIYSEDSETKGRQGLLSLHLKSAIKVSKKEAPIIILTNVTQKDFEDDHEGIQRSIFHVSSLIEASKQMKLTSVKSEEDSILKAASLLKWRKLSFCVVTGNSLLHDKLTKAGHEVFSLENCDKVHKT